MDGVHCLWVRQHITSLAVGVVVVLTFDGSATEVGLVRAAGWVPYLLFGLFAGVLIDRIRRRPVLIVTDLGRGILLCVIPLLAWVGHLTIGWLVAVMAWFGLHSLLHDSAFQAFAPRLVPARLLTPAHARFDQSDAVAQASGPALAGGLISLFGAPTAVLVDAVTFLVSGALLWQVRVSEPVPARLSARAVPSEVREGLRWVYRHATLAAVALSDHAWFLINALTGAVLTPYALRMLGLSPFGLGLAVSLAGAGALASSLVSVQLGARYGAGRVVIASRAACALAFVLMALGTASWTGWILFGAANWSSASSSVRRMPTRWATARRSHRTVCRVG